MKVNQIYKKIEVLFPETNFYFYDARQATETAEKREIRNFIMDCKNAQRYHISKGNLEPIHHYKAERELIADEMLNLLTRCVNELV